MGAAMAVKAMEISKGCGESRLDRSEKKWRKIM